MTRHTNDDIRCKAGGYGIPLWMIAERLGITDSSFSRKLRKELPIDEKEKIFAIIEKIAAEREG